MIGQLVNDPVVLGWAAVAAGILLAAFLIDHQRRQVRNGRRPVEFAEIEIPEPPHGDVPYIEAPFDRMCRAELSRPGVSCGLRCGLLFGHEPPHYDPIEELDFLTAAEFRVLDGEPYHGAAAEKAKGRS